MLHLLSYTEERPHALEKIGSSTLHGTVGLDASSRLIALSEVLGQGLRDNLRERDPTNPISRRDPILGCLYRRGTDGKHATELAARATRRYLAATTEFFSFRRQRYCSPPVEKCSARTETKADVIEPNAVGIKTFATRSEHSNLLRNEVDYLTELRFLLADLVFRSLAIFDVGDDAIPFDDVLLFVAHCDFLVQHPTVLPVSAPNPRFVQEGSMDRCSDDGKFQQKRTKRVYPIHEAPPARPAMSLGYKYRCLPTIRSRQLP
jgi:hypothetical protein